MECPDTSTQTHNCSRLSTSQDLNKLAAIVRGELPKLSRAVLCALITLDVHARDMVTGMVKREVSVAWRCRQQQDRLCDHRVAL